MTASPAADSLIDDEERYWELSRAADAGEFAGRAVLAYIASQLPDGYRLDENTHVIRTDPALPEVIHITSRLTGRKVPVTTFYR